MKTFREWLQLREAGGLWATQGEPFEEPTPKSPATKNKDLNNKKFGVGGGGATGGQAMMTGTGQGLGGMHPVRMKKMKT